MRVKFYGKVYSFSKGTDEAFIVGDLTAEMRDAAEKLKASVTKSVTCPSGCTCLRDTMLIVAERLNKMRGEEIQ